MRNDWRLDAKAPALAAAFRSASADKQRAAALRACEVAIQAARLQNDSTQEALDALRAQRPAAEDLKVRLETTSTRLDDEYFRLDDEAVDETTKGEALHIFSQARAAAAVGFAIVSRPAELHEALYEALSAVDDPTAMTQLLIGLLR